MSGPIPALRVTVDDLYTSKVDAYIEEQTLLRRPTPEETPRSWLTRLFLSGCFYLSVAAGLGGLVGWAALEPFYDDMPVEGFDVGNLLLFPTVAGCIGLFLGAAEGMICRNPLRALVSGAVGLGIGFGGGFLALIGAGIIFSIMVQVSVAFWKNPQPDQMPSGIALLIFMMGRSAAWAVAAIPAGIGQGIALREKKVIVIGLVGGVLGGLAGGFLFDPISILLSSPDDATLSRAIGFTVIGVFVGFFVGLVEQWSKTAWLLMKAGPLAGKQFIIYRNPTVLGSSPKADIYLFKDPAIEPRHALIHDRGGRFEIEDCDSRDGVYVNGLPVRKQILKPGDSIVLGETVLEFSLKESRA